MDVNESKRAVGNPGIGWIVLFVVVLQLYSRFSGAPVADFVADSWSYLAWGQDHESYASIWQQALREPDRPLYSGVTISLFHLIGDNPAAFAILGAVLYSLIIVLIMGLVHELTADRRVVLLSGVLFALLPNLTESFHWAIIIAFSYVQLAYVGSAWLLVRFAKSGRRLDLLGSVLLYAVGAWTYEVGLGLPFVYLFVLWGRDDRRKLLGSLWFFAVLLLYLTWRLTGVFGYGQRMMYADANVHISLSFLLLRWNVIEAARWWIGSHMLSCIVNGLSGFRGLGCLTKLLLLVGNGAVLVSVVWALSRLFRGRSGPEVAAQPFKGWQVVCFAFGWALVGLAPSFLLYTAPRVLFFPAVGIVLFAAFLLAKWPVKAWLPVAAAIGLLCLFVNQGTAGQWKESGALSRNLYQFFQTHRDEWMNQEVIFFDTRPLRESVNVRIPRMGGDDPSSWAQYGNAPLIRGFVPFAMIDLINPAGPNPLCVLDVEHGARVEGNTLRWHERYNPDAPHETVLDRVFVVDGLAATACLATPRGE